MIFAVEMVSADAMVSARNPLQQTHIVEIKY